MLNPEIKSQEAHDTHTIDKTIEKFISEADLNCYESAMNDIGREKVIGRAQKLADSNAHDFSSWVKKGLSINKANCVRIIARLHPNYIANNVSKFSLSPHDFYGITSGINTLEMLAEAAGKGFPDALLTVLNLYPGGFTNKVFENTFQALLEAAINKRKPELLLTVMTQYPKVFKKEEFTKYHQKAKGDHIATLALFPPLARENDLFLTVLKQYPGEFKDYFCDPHFRSIQGTVTFLHHLASACCYGRSDALLTLLNQYPEAFNATDFLKTIDEKVDPPIQNLGEALLRGQSLAFVTVLNQYPRLFTPETFTCPLKTGIFKGETLLDLLVQKAAKYTNAFPDSEKKIAAAAIKALIQILKHTPFSLEILNRFKPYHVMVLIADLINARIEFRKLLDEHCKETNALLSAAAKAQKAGYAEAFFELGNYYETNRQDEDALAAFIQLPPGSIQLDSTGCVYSAKCLGWATQASTQLTKMDYFKKATQFALKIVTEGKRHQSLQMIAKLYIEWRLLNKVAIDHHIIPDFLLQAMHTDTSTEWCFKIFDMLAETEQLKMAAKEKDEKIEKLKAKRKLEKENHHVLLEPVKHFLATYEANVNVASNEAPSGKRQPRPKGH